MRFSFGGPTSDGIKRSRGVGRVVFKEVIDVHTFRRIHEGGRRAFVGVEALEGRALLSQIGPGPRALAVHARGAEVSVSGLRLGPLFQKQGPGYVVKSPRFNPAYTGAPLSELNAAGLKAAADQTDLYLTGIVTADEVPASIEPGDDNLYYSFGINRGAAPSPGLFPGRPHLTADAVVSVGVTQAGISASLFDRYTGTVTNLSAESVLLKQNALRVTVPLDLLRVPGGAGPRAWSAFFWTADQPTADLGHVGSFAPEFHRVSVVPALHHFRPTT